MNQTHLGMKMAPKVIKIIAMTRYIRYFAKVLVVIDETFNNFSMLLLLVSLKGGNRSPIKDAPNVLT